MHTSPAHTGSLTETLEALTAINSTASLFFFFFFFCFEEQQRPDYEEANSSSCFLASAAAADADHMVPRLACSRPSCPALEEMVDSRPLGAPGEEVCHGWILENNQQEAEREASRKKSLIPHMLN